MMAFPIIIQGLVFQVQSLTDKAFLGNLDTKYISSLGAAQMPFYCSMDALVALSTGVIILVSRHYGAGQRDKVNAYIKSSMFYNSILSILLFFMWTFLGKNILQLLSVDPVILPYCTEYIQIVALGFIVLGIDIGLQGMLQGVGQTKPIMYAGLVKVGVNVLLSWVLVFGHFGFPALHIRGAALGTLISNLLSLGFLMIYCLSYKEERIPVT